MTFRRSFCLLLLAMAAPSAWTTSTICRFDRHGDSRGFDLEFLGYGEVAMILFQSDDGPHSLPGGSYEVLDFDESAARIHLVYRNPGDPDLLPSFTLKGSGKDVRLLVGGERIVGELDCGY